MKRFLTLILCMALVLTAVSAQAVSIANIVGRWYLIQVDGNGISGETYVEFNRNKTITLVINGTPLDTSDYEWTFADDTVSIKKPDSFLSDFRLEATETALTLTSNKLDVLTNDTRYHDFTLAREAASYYTPAIVPAVSEDQFYGDFVLYLAMTNGMYLPMTSEENGFEIEAYMATVFSEGQDPAEYLTDFADGRLTVYANQETYISATADPDVLVAYVNDDLSDAAYLRRRGTQQPENIPAAPVATQVPVAATPVPAAPEATAKPASPSFPAMINQPVATPIPAAPAPAGDSAESYYGTYIVYQDVLANGQVLDMTSRNLRATIDADGVHAEVYGQKATVPYTYANGVMTADLTPVSPDYGFATAARADNGDLIVTLADASGNVGETLYLRAE